MCQELAEFLLEEQTIKNYTNKLGFIKHNRYFISLSKTKTFTVPEDPQLEEEDQNGSQRFGTPRRYPNQNHSNKSNIVIGPAMTLFKDKEIVETFAVNALEPNIVVVATRRDLIELDLSKANDFADRLNPVSRFQEHLTTSGIRLSASHDSLLTLEVPQKDPNNKLRESKSNHDIQVDNRKQKQPQLANVPPDTITQKIVGRASGHTTIEHMQSHPKHPYYLTGGEDGTILLYQFKVANSVAQYLPSGPRINKIRFNASGSRFSACDNSGNVKLWRWSSQEESIQPYKTLKCHQRVYDMSFLNLGSFFATAGISPGNENVGFWDSLLRDDKANVWNNVTLDGGASILAYSPRHQMLFAGGKRGGISIIDLRQRQVYKTIDKAHDNNCTSLTITPNFHYLISGSSDGSIKIWNIFSDFREDPEDFELPLVQKFDEVHKQHTFVTGPLTSGAGFSAPTVNTVGVSQVVLDWDFLYSCGSDGRLIRRKLNTDDL